MENQMNWTARLLLLLAVFWVCLGVPPGQCLVLPSDTKSLVAGHSAHGRATNSIANGSTASNSTRTAQHCSQTSFCSCSCYGSLALILHCGTSNALHKFQSLYSRPLSSLHTIDNIVINSWRVQSRLDCICFYQLSPLLLWMDAGSTFVWMSALLSDCPAREIHNTFNVRY